ncbi:Nucleotide exchange factor SIL1 [Halotydeus destructor]|nr:Nucleotide exchange factor SIL1 [Halotydeus destructor]
MNGNYLPVVVAFSLLALLRTSFSITDNHGLKVVHAGDKEEASPSTRTLVVSEHSLSNNDAIVTDNSEQFTVVKDVPGQQFTATNEWQEIESGHIIPPGLHYRINLATGKKEAKLIDGHNEENNEKEHDVSNVYVNDKYKKLLRVKNSGVSHSIEGVKDEVDGDETEREQIFRTIDELKDATKKSHIEIKAESELVKQLLDRYAKQAKLKNTKICRDEKRAILMDLEFNLHKIDAANDFVKMGGLDLIIPDLNVTYDADLRALVAMTLGTAMQNNPPVQRVALESKLLPALLRLLTSDDSLLVKQRSLYALSCLIRNYPVAQVSFVANGGVNSLSALFSSKRTTSVKLQVKAVSLIIDILAEKANGGQDNNDSDRQLIEAFESNEFCDHILTLLKSRERDAVFAALNAASQVINGNWLCKEKIESHIDILKNEALHLLKSYNEDADELHRWVEELIGERPSHDEL